MSVNKMKGKVQKHKPLMAVLLFTALGGINSSYAKSIETPQKMVEQWLSLERQASQLQSHWSSQQPLLEQRVLLLEAEKQQLTALLNESSSDFGQVEQKRSTLVQEQSTLETEQHKLEQSLSQLQYQLVALQNLLAPPITQAWQQESKQPLEDAQTSQQLQLSLAKLTKLAEFNQRINLLQAPITNENGEDIIVKQLFIGASMGWFVSPDGSYVGSGQIHDGAWQWQFDPNLDSQQISQAIAMFEKQAEADFVHLPFNLLTQEGE